MKARAVVFTHVQPPFKLHGLPPKLVALSAFGAMLVWVIAIVSGFAGEAMLIAAAVMGAELVACYFIGRTDPHVESLFLLTTTFWRMSSRRWLLAGAPSDRSRRGRK